MLCIFSDEITCFTVKLLVGLKSISNTVACASLFSSCFLIDFKVICYVCNKGRVLVLCCPDGSEQLDAPPKGSEQTPNLEEGSIFNGGRVKVYLRSFGFTKTGAVQKNIGQSIWLNSRGSISNCRSPMRRYLSLRGGWEQMWSILSMFYITHSKSSR